MMSILVKAKEFLKTNKKKIIGIIVGAMITLIVVIGGVGGVQYSHAKSNIKYNEDQLQKIALAKVPGEVLKVDKKLNFKDGVFEYRFKIKDKYNMLQTVKLDSQYGVILGANNENHIKESKNRHHKHR